MQVESAGSHPRVHAQRRWLGGAADSERRELLADRRAAGAGVELGSDDDSHEHHAAEPRTEPARDVDRTADGETDARRSLERSMAREAPEPQRIALEEGSFGGRRERRRDPLHDVVRRGDRRVGRGTLGRHFEQARAKELERADGQSLRGVRRGSAEPALTADQPYN